MKILAKLMLMLMMLGGAMAQNGYYTDRAVGTSQFNGFTGLVPIQYGQVRVCTSVDINTSTTPCPDLASIFNIAGSSLTVAGGNFGQVTTDVVGRFNFQAVPGSYWVQVAASGSNTPSLAYAVTVSPTTLTPSGLIVGGNNFWTGLNSFKSINNVKYADQYAGDICAAINLAIADLPSTGGMVKAFEQGNQPCASDPFSGVTKQVDVEFGAGLTVQPIVTWNVPSNVHLHGAGDMTSVIAFQPAGGATEANKADQIKMTSASNIEIDHLKITGTANTARLISMALSSNVRVHHTTISGAGYLPAVGTLAGINIDRSSDVWVENNIFTGNGPASASNSTNSDIVVWQTAASNRIHIRNNQVSGGTSDGSITMFDCLDCDVIGNTVDENNQIRPTLNAGGYGIVVYSSFVRPRNVRVLANQVSNTAGSGIYIASNDRALVADNVTFNTSQQETDATLPVGGISVNDCLDCSISTNIVNTSTKDGIVIAAPVVGMLVTKNSIKGITQYGIGLRGAITDATISDNIIDTTTNEGMFSGTSLTRTKIAGNFIRGTSRSAILLANGTLVTISQNQIYALTAGFTAIGATTTCNYCQVNGNIMQELGVNYVGIGLTGATIYQINDNFIADGGAASTGISLGAGSADGVIENNLIRSLNTGINSSAGARAHIAGNKFLVNSPSLTVSATDTFGQNPADANPTSAVLFANLGTPPNGTFLYCSDCTIANPTAGGGTGAFVKRLNGVWVGN